jgi:hypothetical protein
MNDVKFFTQMTNIIKLIEGVPYADAALNPNGNNADTAIPSGHAAPNAQAPVKPSPKPVHASPRVPTKKDPAVLKIQQDLIAKGYPLKPDGIMGPKTQAAMDWEAKSNVRDAGSQATKNMDPNQPAPAVPTDPTKKAAYDAAIKNMDPNQPAATPAQPVAQPQEIDPDYADWEDKPYSTKYLDPKDPGLDSLDPNVKTWDFGAMADENPELLKKYQIASYRKNNPDGPLPTELGGPGMQSTTPEYSGSAPQQQQPAAPSNSGVTPAQQDFKDMVTQSSDAWHNHVQQGNAAAQPASPPDSSNELADAAHTAFLKHDPTPQDIDLINRARTTLPSWQQPGVKSMFEQSELARILQLAKW